MPATRLIIVDDHPLFRGALNQALTAAFDDAAIEECGSLDELNGRLGADKDVDLILLDLTMPGVQGLSGLLYLRAQYPEIPIVVVSANEDGGTIRRCIEFGASGFVPKSQPIDQIRGAVKAVLDGDVWTPPDIDLSADADQETSDLLARLSSLTPQQVRDYAQTIDEQATRMTGIIRYLLDFARQREAQRTPTPVMSLIEQTVGLTTSLGYKGQVRIEADGQAAQLRPEMDANQIQQVLINLIENALQAMPEGGEATIGVQAIEATPPSDADAAPGRYVRIDVRDTGVGIAPEHLDELFDPFFTTKDVGEGTGLGLSIVHGIVSEHSGWIDVASEPGRGSCFSIYLPDGETT